MLECVVNISEGRERDRVARIAATAGPALLDVHSDPHHHRSVLTLVGEEATRAVAAETVRLVDLTSHDGVHPRLGAVDVVPFVALGGDEPAAALDARDRFAAWFAREHGVPCFLYGPERALPELRRHAFTDLVPQAGPASPHPTAGACAVGQRPVLVAYNVWVRGEPAAVRATARAVRDDTVRALGLAVGDRHQVSMNLVAPEIVGPAAAFDRVALEAQARGVEVEGAELVGLLPRRVLDVVPRHRWAELDVDDERTIEARLEQQGWR